MSKEYLVPSTKYRARMELIFFLSNMPINSNHTIEDLGDVKCAIVEKNVSAERCEFLKKLLEFNKFSVVTVPSPPPKTAAKPADPAADTTAEPQVPPETPSTFTLGVTDLRFNMINAIFGRLLRSPDGHVVTLAYWKQEENVSDDEVPYFEKK